MPNLVSIPKIFIVGSSVTQNELLAHDLQDSLGYPCVAYREINQISWDDIKKGKTLILLDYKDDNWKTILHNIKQETDLMSGNTKCFIALFNVIPVNGTEKELVRTGIRGIFYTHHSQDVILKGIKAILKEELWLPRTLLNTIFLKYQNYDHDSEIFGPLSFREKQILDLLSTGYTNALLADKLCISIHTVKTHIYNIYRKINVNNRLQAVQWINNKRGALG